MTEYYNVKWLLISCSCLPQTGISLEGKRLHLNDDNVMINWEPCWMSEVNVHRESSIEWGNFCLGSCLGCGKTKSRMKYLQDCLKWTEWMKLGEVRERKYLMIISVSAFEIWNW